VKTISKTEAKTFMQIWLSLSLFGWLVWNFSSWTDPFLRFGN